MIGIYKRYLVGYGFSNSLRFPWWDRYGTGEFEVTTERLGCYQPTEHIDNPLGYAEGDDARQYDRRLRGPVDAESELSIDPRTGRAYILEDGSI